MGGGGKQPSEETIVDTTNVGLLNMSNTGMTYFGVGEILTVLVFNTSLSDHWELLLQEKEESEDGGIRAVYKKC